MKKIKPLDVARALVIAGVLVFAVSVFMDSFNIAQLSSLKGNLSLYEKSVDRAYSVDEPMVPTDYSRYVPAPVMPDTNKAAVEEMKDYNKKLNEYNALVGEETKKYAAALKEYAVLIKDYDYQKKMADYRKKLAENKIEKDKKDLNASIKTKEIEINIIDATLLMRFIGSCVMLIGALGELVWAEALEKLGVLVMLGFAFKTIVGL